MIVEEKTYKWILTVKETGEYLSYHIIDDMPPCGEPEKLQWREWNKPLPDDIDIRQEEGNPYTLDELTELYKDWEK